MNHSLSDYKITVNYNYIEYKFKAEGSFMIPPLFCLSYPQNRTFLFDKSCVS